MIQFQPAQDVKDALTGKKASSDPAATTAPHPSQKSPLAMSISESSKLSGIFKNSAPGSSPSASPDTASQTDEKTDETPQGTNEVTATPAFAPASESTPPDTPPEAGKLSELEAANSMMQTGQSFSHEPTDPHGVHDTAHPDEPEPQEFMTSIEPSTPAETASGEAVETHSVPETNHEPDQPTAAPASEETTTKPGEESTVTPKESAPAPHQAPEGDDFRTRLKSAMEKLDADIAQAEAEETRLLSEAARATTVVKSKKAERKQLEALQNIDPDLLQSVVKVMQGTEEKKAT